MTVYEVWSFDSMASRGGTYERDATYANRTDAEAHLDRIRRSSDEYYAKHPEYSRQYESKPYIEEVRVL